MSLHPTCLRASFTAGLLGVLSLAFTPTSALAAPSQQSIDRAHRVLGARATGVAILSYLHAGAPYNGHDYVRTDGVLGRPDDFALIYQFRWDGDGRTELIVFCDRNGDAYEVRAGASNGVFSRPWDLAKLTIQVLGNALVEAFDKQMTPQEKADARRMVDAVDVSGLCLANVRALQAR
jgi:hypothetical protein